MDNGFFCSECKMIKQRCICSTKKLKENKSTGIPRDHMANLKLENPGVKNRILNNFPFEEPREGQLEIISKIDSAIEEGYKYIILEAGTGTGKSAIATTLARMYEPSYILTMTKQLQSQYANEFSYPLVKGRGNFSCKSGDLEISCDNGMCQTTPRSQKFSCDFGVTKTEGDEAHFAFEDAGGFPYYFKSMDKCSYWQQKADAANSDITLMNYDYALLELNYVRHFPKRNFMVLDEAHNIEDKLMRRLEVNLLNQSLEKDIKKTIPPQMLNFEDPEEWILFVEILHDAYKEINTKKLPKNKGDRIVSTRFRLRELLTNLEEHAENWVVDPTPGGVSFKPLKIDLYAQNMLFKHADICLFMSATILDHRLFCKWLGIDYKEAYPLKIKSNFPASGRPVYIKPVGNMSQRSIKFTAPKTLPILKKIMDHHKHEKGLIHTHNYKCQKYIMANLKDPRLMGHTYINREMKLQQFEKTDKAMVLVSPSMSEGVDLPYEKCQFQVIYKIPFPYLGDKQVNSRKKHDPKWYAYKTIMTLIQAYGRGMRAEDDFCATYILDRNIKMLFNNPLYKALVPRSFKEAIALEEEWLITDNFEEEY
ncbi:MULTISPECIES: helicase C-terminal domain-containing protein [Methanobacterium]|uniref:ATP-dependent helicase n=1 Tax=Methanobacterium bryantii TaxID=2161 RepID=A0A2A2H1F3_METBR|nr:MULTISPECIES: ATP-dependent DNA helicase [Methanobacterium]OEC86418.1 ATP-dependent helicase [Methanobacterium sp. A39]PAV03185.1 ATP-dependent helicase [Methanobacterium bryantii]